MEPTPRSSFQTPPHKASHFTSVTQSIINSTSSRKRGCLSGTDDEKNTVAKVACTASAAVVPAALGSESSGRGHSLFLHKAAPLCQELCRRIGFPADRVELHQALMNKLIGSLPRDVDLSFDMVRELTIIALGHSLNLAGHTICTVLQNNELNQQCEMLKARLLNLNLNDMKSEYDKVAERWIPGPLFSDVKIFCNAVEIALLMKRGKAWPFRFAS